MYTIFDQITSPTLEQMSIITNYSYELRKPFQNKKKFKRKKTGSIIVHLKEGRALKICDRNGKSDPYAILNIGKQTFKSKVMKRTVNPKWDETFIFTVIDPNATVWLKIIVMDSDLLV